MNRYLLAALAFIVAITSASAQQPELLVKSGDKGLYVEHKIVPKESFFAVSRKYNVHPRTIAVYNKLDYNKGLVIGQTIRIPLSDTNFTQKGNSGTPLYYKVGEGEGLMKVSSLYRDVTLETLRGWNNLADNSVAPGKKLVIGFLVTKGIPPVTLTPKTTPVTETVKNDPPKTEPVTEVVKNDPPKTEPVKNDPPKTEPVREDPKPVFASNEEKSSTNDQGYFRYHFEQQVKKNPVSKDATVTSGIFKTTSGWLDAKYYLLIDGVQPGIIVKVMNPANNRIIFAKVLGEMSGIKQNEGLNLRLSSAAASALQVTETDKFIVKVNY
jgi:LysM repeat protein